MKREIYAVILCCIMVTLCSCSNQTVKEPPKKDIEETIHAADNETEQLETNDTGYSDRVGNRENPLGIGDEITLDFRNYNSWNYMNATFKLVSLENNLATFEITLNDTYNSSPLQILNYDDYMSRNTRLSFIMMDCDRPSTFVMNSDEYLCPIESVTIGIGETQMVRYDVTDINYLALITQLGDEDYSNLTDYDDYRVGDESGTYYYYTFYTINSKD